MCKKNMFIICFACVALLFDFFTAEKHSEICKTLDAKTVISAHCNFDNIEFFKTNTHKSTKDALKNSLKTKNYIFIAITTICVIAYIVKRFFWMTAICCIKKRYLICYIHKKDGKKQFLKTNFYTNF